MEMIKMLNIKYHDFQSVIKLLSLFTIHCYTNGTLAYVELSQTIGCMKGCITTSIRGQRSKCVLSCAQLKETSFPVQ